MVKKRELEEKLFKDNLKEAIKESKEPKKDGKIQGIIGIIIGFLGLFLPGFLTVVTGIIAVTLGSYANKHGQRKLGIACGIIALISLAYFFIIMGDFSFI